MVRLENEVKLDYKDVLIRPKRSTLNSRREVSLSRTFNFVNSKRTWTGVPVAVANMDTTGTFEMAVALAKYQVLVCIHKHYTLEEWKAFGNKNADVLQYVAVSSGTSDADLQLVKEIMTEVPQIPFVCLDVANGYAEGFVQAVRSVRANHPDKIIMAGNVVTGRSQYARFHLIHLFCL